MPVELPRRPDLVPEPAPQPQRADGSLDSVGPGPIRDEEKQPPKRWYKTAPRGERSHAEAELRSLGDADLAAMMLVRLMDMGAEEPRPRTWFLVHQPGASLEPFAEKVAGMVFRDPAAHVVVDCRQPDKGHYALFGAPPGYRGCLEGGTISNRLIMRPETVVVLDNYEYADTATLNTLYNFAAKGHSRVGARGAVQPSVSPVDALFVLATSLCHEQPSPNQECLRSAFREARPDFTPSYVDWLVGQPVVHRPGM